MRNERNENRKVMNDNSILFTITLKSVKATTDLKSIQVDISIENHSFEAEISNCYRHFHADIV